MVSSHATTIASSLIEAGFGNFLPSKLARTRLVTSRMSAARSCMGIVFHSFKDCNEHVGDFFKPASALIFHWIVSLILTNHFGVSENHHMRINLRCFFTKTLLHLPNKYVLWSFKSCIQTGFFTTSIFDWKSQMISLVEWAICLSNGSTVRCCNFLLAFLSYF